MFTEEAKKLTLEEKSDRLLRNYGIIMYSPAIFDYELRLSVNRDRKKHE